VSDEPNRDKERAVSWALALHERELLAVTKELLEAIRAKRVGFELFARADRLVRSIEEA